MLYRLGADRAATSASLGEPTANYAQLPRWRGFNLLEKLTVARNKPYSERDLDLVASWGFDFVRLPADYRIWTTSPGEYVEQPLEEIDEVIAWARARGLHLNLCLHRAPGYCINPPAEPLDLWADDPGGDEARQQFAAQWRMLAARYRGIPSAELSFDLVNEPPAMPGGGYARALAPAIASIREEDEGRLIIVDGVGCGEHPVPELVPFKVGQSTRGYWPFLVSHYRASWIPMSDQWPVPTWPVQVMMNQFLYGDAKPEFQRPLALRLDCPERRRFGITVHQVSNSAELVVRANGAVVWRKLFRSERGVGKWWGSVFRSRWQGSLGTYDKEYVIGLPAGTREVQVEVGKGDWLTWSAVRFSGWPNIPDHEVELKTSDSRWGVLQQGAALDRQGNLLPTGGQAQCSRETLWAQYVHPWKDFSVQHGIGIHVGEWGVYNQTPHDVALRWMQDCLDNWRRAGIGWALWNLAGTFGVLDSGRKDVAYENCQGRKLDREMLELLKLG